MSDDEPVLRIIGLRYREALHVRKALRGVAYIHAKWAITWAYFYPRWNVTVTGLNDSQAERVVAWMEAHQ